jgi:hypothetical protein
MANPNNPGGGQGGAGGPANPPKRPTPGDAHQNMAKVVDAFARDFRKRDGSTFVIVTEDAVKTFTALVDSGDGDALALYLENPVQLLLALTFSLSERLKALETRVEVLERRP